MATTSETPVHGYQLAGASATVQGAQTAGDSVPVHGGQLAGTHTEQPPTRGITPRGTAFGGGGPTPGYQFGQPTIPGFGGTYGGAADPSVADLIDVDGFALVLENQSRSERLAFSPAEPTYRSIKNVSFTAEVNKMASWQSRIPMDSEVYGWNFAYMTLAYGGERRFHGVLLETKPADLRDGELTLSGYGPLYWAGHGDLELRYASMPSWRALEDIWLKVAEATDGKIRGTVVRPRPEHANDHWIPSEGVEWSGTPAEILQQAHGYAGMAFSFDHSDPSAVATSFVPGEELRNVPFQATSEKPAINVEGYHNQIKVVGAKRPGIGESTAEGPSRYSATATAPQREIDAVLDGKIHDRTVRDFDLESEQACRARATTILAEDRGEYTVGGSLSVTPDVRTLVPGYTYRIEAFDPYVPALFSPVWATLRSVQQTYGPDEATVALSFADESRLVEHIREDLVPDSAPTSVKRRDVQIDAADPNYDPPMNVTYAAGDGVAGSRFAGAAGVGRQQ